MIPAALFHQSVTIQNRDLSDPDPMESSTDWEDVEDVFCMINMFPTVQRQKPYDANQPVGLQRSVRIILRGNYSLPAGETRLLWGSEIYEPVSVEFYPGLFRNEDLTYIIATRTSGLTAP